jgi:hypothetical protein
MLAIKHTDMNDFLLFTSCIYVKNSLKYDKALCVSWFEVQSARHNNTITSCQWSVVSTLISVAPKTDSHLKLCVHVLCGRSFSYGLSSKASHVQNTSFPTARCGSRTFQTSVTNVGYPSPPSVQRRRWEIDLMHI